MRQDRRDPIEQAFAKLKALLRAKAFRTVEALWKVPGNLLDCFTPPPNVVHSCEMPDISSQPEGALVSRTRSSSDHSTTALDRTQ